MSSRIVKRSRRNILPKQQSRNSLYQQLTKHSESIKERTCHDSSLNHTVTLCEDCEELDFGQDINLKSFDNGKSSGGGVIGPVDHIEEGRDCELCQFLNIFKVQRGASQSPLFLKAILFSKLFNIPKDTIKDVLIYGVCPASYSLRSNDKGLIIPAHQDQDRASGRIVSSLIDFSIPRYWLDICSQNHTNCQKGPGKLSSIPGFRVIDCDTKQIQPWKDDSDEYLTLSYVWGSPSTTVEDDDEMKLPKSIPLVIEDAITTTKCLGFRYLWVDRYCIPQNRDCPEKLEQIASMGMIYQQSSLTLIAAAGEDPSYGLPGVSSRFRAIAPTIRLGQDTLLVSTLPHILKEVNESTWSKRGWTYQEGLLSRRRLVFTDNQIHFSCWGMQCLESLSVPLKSLHTQDMDHFIHNVEIPRAFPLRGLGYHSTSIIERIEEYMKRDLTYDSDALNAMQGVLKAFENKSPPVRHVNGIPIFTFSNETEYDTRHGGKIRMLKLLLGLCWRIEGEATRRRSFPSWTWLGWKLNHSQSRWFIQVPLADLRVKPMLDRLGPSCCTNISLDGFKEDSGGPLDWQTSRMEIGRKLERGDHPKNLIATGPIFNLKVKRSFEEVDCIEPSWVENSGNLVEITRHAKELSSPQNRELSTFQFSCLVICHYQYVVHVLVLQRSNEVSKAYERAGFCWFTPKDDDKIIVSQDGEMTIGSAHIKYESVFII